MNLSELSAKYKLGDSAKYEPDPNCRHCQGKGEHFSKALNTTTFCACLFFDPSFREEALGHIRNAVRAAFPDIVGKKPS
jgi:hypothetical protein